MNRPNSGSRRKVPSKSEYEQMRNQGISETLPTSPGQAADSDNSVAYLYDKIANMVNEETASSSPTAADDTRRSSPNKPVSPAKGLRKRAPTGELHQSSTSTLREPKSDVDINSRAHYTRPFEPDDAVYLPASDKTAYPHKSRFLADYFDISPQLNINDDTSVHFLVESSIADARGAHILSYDELEKLKRERTVVESRLKDLQMQLNLQIKLRDAAGSIARLHRSESTDSNVSSNSNRRVSWKDVIPGKMMRRSSSHQGSISALEEMEQTERRITQINNEIDALRPRSSVCTEKIIRHNAAILALTHQGTNRGDSAQATSPVEFSSQLQSLTTQLQEAKTEAESLRNRLTAMETESSSRGSLSTTTPRGSTSNSADVDRLELENIDLKAQLRDVKFQAQAEIQQLQNELRTCNERIAEARETHEANQAELKNALDNLQVLTHEAVGFEAERTKLESTIEELTAKVQQLDAEVINKRVDNNGAVSQQTSPAMILLINEFQTITSDLLEKHREEVRALTKENQDLRKLNHRIKTVSFIGEPSEMANNYRKSIIESRSASISAN